jgi:hypothetical protein
MFIYNVTLSIDKVIEPEWVHWMKAEHIPHVMNTGLFTDYKFFKVLSHDDPSTSSCALKLIRNMPANTQLLERYWNK